MILEDTNDHPLYNEIDQILLLKAVRQITFDCILIKTNDIKNNEKIKYTLGTGQQHSS